MLNLFSIISSVNAFNTERSIVRITQEGVRVNNIKGVKSLFVFNEKENTLFLFFIPIDICPKFVEILKSTSLDSICKYHWGSSLKLTRACTIDKFTVKGHVDVTITRPQHAALSIAASNGSLSRIYLSGSRCVSCKIEDGSKVVMSGRVDKINVCNLDHTSSLDLTSMDTLDSNFFLVYSKNIHLENIVLTLATPEPVETSRERHVKNIEIPCIDDDSDLRKEECQTCCAVEHLAIFHPCRHQLMCRLCTQRHKQTSQFLCPLCRSEIQEVSFYLFS